MSVGALLAKWAHFGTGGWWVGGTHMIANQSFIQEVSGLNGQKFKADNRKRACDRRAYAA